MGFVRTLLPILVTILILRGDDHEEARIQRHCFTKKTEKKGSVWSRGRVGEGTGCILTCLERAPRKFASHYPSLVGDSNKERLNTLANVGGYQPYFT